MMKTYTHKVIDDIGPQNVLDYTKHMNEKIINEVKTPQDYALELDFSQVKNVTVSPSTGISLQHALKSGFQKIIISNHKLSDLLAKQPSIKLLLSRGQLEIK